jgi:ATP synthase protein I
MIYKAMAIDAERKKLLKSLGAMSSIGISVALAIAIGVFVGLKLDKWLGTDPWFFFIFLFIGIVAGFRNIFILIGREITKNGPGEDRRK